MMRHFKSALMGGAVLFLSMCLTSCDDFFGHEDKPVPGNVTPYTPLTLKALKAGTIVVNNPQSGMQYKKNDGTKIAMTATTTIDVAKGDKVEFYGSGTKITKYYIDDSSDSNDTSISGGTAKVKVYGNIMSLVDEKNFATATALTGNDAFCELFIGNRTLTDASDLLLPATTLTTGCYMAMFWDCSSLSAAPELPATKLAEECYWFMFAGCTSLTTAPELPATTLADGCYYCMFYECAGLTAAPKLPVTTLADNCYDSMFRDCTGLTTAPELPATTLAVECYRDMFRGCTSLTAAPKLPVTTLAVSCYDGMFRECTGLTTAPELPATTLAAGCYFSMFEECTSLTVAPELKATTLADDCYSYMFFGCTGLTTAPELPATTLAAGCYAYMFMECSNLSSVTCLATDISATGCTEDWLYGVAESGTLTTPSTTAWTEDSDSGIPSGWTRVEP